MRRAGSALAAGGLPCAEVTFRTAAALRVAPRRWPSGPEVLVGRRHRARATQVDAAVEAGARFIVSPGFSRRRGRALPGDGCRYCPGSPPRPRSMGAAGGRARHGQVLPRRVAVAGCRLCKALRRAVPVGAVRADRRASPPHLPGYLAVPAVLAVGGTWMVAPDLLGGRGLGRGSPPGGGRGQSPVTPWRSDAVTLGSARRGLSLRPGRPRRGDAAPRSGRGADPHRPQLPGLGGRRRVQRGPRAAALLRPAHGRGHRLRRQRGRAGWSRTSSCRAGSTRPSSAGCPTTASAAPSATASTSPSAASASVARSASPTAASTAVSQLQAR